MVKILNNKEEKIIEFKFRHLNIIQELKSYSLMNRLFNYNKIKSLNNLYNTTFNRNFNFNTITLIVNSSSFFNNKSIDNIFLKNNVYNKVANNGIRYKCALCVIDGYKICIHSSTRGSDISFEKLPETYGNFLDLLIKLINFCKTKNNYE